MTEHLSRSPRSVRYGTVDSSVIRDPEIGVAATAVYALLTTYASGHGERAAYPSRETMAAALGCSTDTVDRALKVLRDRGVLVSHRRQRQTALHFLHDMGAPRAVGAQNPDSADPGTQDLDSANSGSLTPQNPALDSAVSGGSSTSGVTPMSNHPSGGVPPAAADGALPGLNGFLDEEEGKPVPSLVAQSLTAEWWERFNPRPTASFPGQRKIVQRLLEVGWTVEKVRAALQTENPPLTLARMEQRLRGFHERPGGLVPAHDWKDGDAWLTR